jgi:hypothetical protein
MQAYNNKRKGGEVSKHTGHFVPVEERKEVAKEIKRSHFTLGSDKSKSPTYFCHPQTANGKATVILMVNCS